MDDDFGDDAVRIDIEAPFSWAALSEVPPLLSVIGGLMAIAGVLLTRRKPVVRTVAP